MHLDEEQIQRLLRGELAPPVATSVREHLAGCTDCRERVTQAEREESEVDSLLRHLDHPAPRIGAHAVLARARRPGLRWGRSAAGVL
ncbi:MAG: anti-sigma factor family protein, partial [Gemmatimonadales bacterium]